MPVLFTPGGGPSETFDLHSSAAARIPSTVPPSQVATRAIAIAAPFDVARRGCAARSDTIRAIEARARAARSTGPRHRDRRRVDEAVADAPHVDDEAVAVGAELVAQPARVRVQRAGRADRPVAPDRAQQLLLREDLAGPRRACAAARTPSATAQRARRAGRTSRAGGSTSSSRPAARPRAGARRRAAAAPRRDRAARVGERLADVVVGPARSHGRGRARPRAR